MKKCLPIKRCSRQFNVPLISQFLVDTALNLWVFVVRREPSAKSKFIFVKLDILKVESDLHLFEASLKSLCILRLDTLARLGNLTGPVKYFKYLILYKAFIKNIRTLKGVSAVNLLSTFSPLGNLNLILVCSPCPAGGSRGNLVSTSFLCVSFLAAVSAFSFSILFLVSCSSLSCLCLVSSFFLK